MSKLIGSVQLFLHIQLGNRLLLLMAKEGISLLFQKLRVEFRCCKELDQAFLLYLSPSITLGGLDPVVFGELIYTSR